MVKRTKTRKIIWTEAQANLVNDEYKRITKAGKIKPFVKRIAEAQKVLKPNLRRKITQRQQVPWLGSEVVQFKRHRRGETINWTPAEKRLVDAEYERLKKTEGLWQFSELIAEAQKVLSAERRVEITDKALVPWLGRLPRVVRDPDLVDRVMEKLDAMMDKMTEAIKNSNKEILQAIKQNNELLNDIYDHLTTSDIPAAVREVTPESVVPPPEPTEGNVKLWGLEVSIRDFPKLTERTEIDINRLPAKAVETITPVKEPLKKERVVLVNLRGHQKDFVESIFGEKIDPVFVDGDHVKRLYGLRGIQRVYSLKQELPEGLRNDLKKKGIEVNVVNSSSALEKKLLEMPDPVH